MRRNSRLRCTNDFVPRDAPSLWITMMTPLNSHQCVRADMLGYLPYPGQTMVTYLTGHKRKRFEDAFSDDFLNPWNTF